MQGYENMLLSFYHKSEKLTGKPEVYILYLWFLLFITRILGVILLDCLYDKENGGQNDFKTD